MTDEKSKLVYSTDKPISKEERPGGDSVKPALNPAKQKAYAGGNVIVRLDRKQRGGKSVTVIEGLRLPEKDLAALLKELKAGLGTGGTLKETALEIQGDHCESLMAALIKRGYKPKRSGG